jgi:hypothetical protein
MKKLFISYSRREAPFADSLLDTLEDHGYNVWLDYHSLVPGKAWEDQIFAGIREADVILLVVSKESMKSPNCKDEWTEAIRSKKRIILVLFEAAPLPPELHGLEWIDFRTSFFKRKLKELINLVENPARPTKEPPQKGFKAPAIVWLTFLLSLVSALLGLGLIMTIYAPYYLLPLPYKIFKRNYDFFHIQSLLIMLPAILLLMGILAPKGEESIYLDTLGTGFVIAIGLLLLLRSGGMRRWGQPMASPAKFANPIPIPKENPEPVRFAVDYAPEDKKYADDTIQRLQKQGHIYDETGKQAGVVFVLISKYKNNTAYNPQEKIVYPILIQNTGNIDRNLQRIQWIDFRRGIDKLDVIAKLLHQPTKMLKAIGVTPTSNQQTILPGVVQALVYFFTATSVFTIGGWLMYFLNNAENVTSGVFIATIIEIALMLGILFLSIRSLVNRKGWLVSHWRMIVTIVVIGILFFAQIGTAFTAVTEEGSSNYLGNSVWFGPFVYILGLFIIIPLTIRYTKNLKRWFPTKAA